MAFGVCDTFGKTYGFILADEPDENVRFDAGRIFVHFSAIDMPGCYRVLRPGQRVSYDLVQTERGPQAVNVKLLED
jgi:CspA family cold shock protein